MEMTLDEPTQQVNTHYDIPRKRFQRNRKLLEQSQKSVIVINLKLPPWPDATRGCSNVILRSALFGVVAPGRRKVLWNHQIAASGKTTIIFSGERLDQSDLNLWLEILHLARRHELGQKITFSARSMIKALGVKSVCGKDIARLKKNIQRLNRANITIKDGGVSGRNLVDAYDISSTGEIVISINPEVANMFSENSWTQIELKHRRQLKSQLSMWLHSFYLSHEHPFHLKTETLRRLSGSDSDNKEFRRMLRASIAELTTLNWEMKIVGDLVAVKHPKAQYERPLPAIVIPAHAANESPAHPPAKPKASKQSWLEQAIKQARNQRAKVAL